MLQRFSQSIVSIFVLLIITQFGVTKAPDSVLGAWLLDEGKGNEIKDVSGKEQHGQIVGASKWTDGPFGKAFLSEGGQIEVPHSDAFLTPTFTLMAWVNVPRIPNDWSMVIIAKDAWPNRNYAMYVAQNAGSVHFAFGTAAKVDVGNFNAPTLIADEEWHHVAMTYDKEMRRVYVDGELDAEKPSNDELGNPAVPVVIGKVAGGMIDEVLIANEALSDDEIKKAAEKGILELLGMGKQVRPFGKLATIWGTLKRNSEFGVRIENGKFVLQ